MCSFTLVGRSLGCHSPPKVSVNRPSATTVRHNFVIVHRRASVPCGAREPTCFAGGLLPPKPMARHYPGFLVVGKRQRKSPRKRKAIAINVQQIDDALRKEYLAFRCLQQADEPPEEQGPWVEGSSELVLEDRKRRRNAVCIIEPADLTLMEGFVLDVIMPTLTRPGYHCAPLLIEIRQMSQAQMKTVDHFQVKREGVGELQWEEPVDLMCADLDAIQIEQSKLRVDVDALEGLNGPCLVTLEGIFPEQGALTGTDQVLEYVHALRRTVEGLGATFVAYDEKKGAVQFRAPQLKAEYHIQVKISPVRKGSRLVRRNGIAPTRESAEGCTTLVLLSPEKAARCSEFVLSTQFAWRIMGYRYRERVTERTALEPGSRQVDQRDRDDDSEPET
eukprot:TRINITY_DN197_c0_g1_i2.p1 TRINITY_DN197_c0_g1~~TRINITY_DN197_c0_g1_i2.p1  ORF type:complete len:390 (+),score=58.93 TRINITY_DN197_c0_g1_i2:78-1247(+)